MYNEVVLEGSAFLSERPYTIKEMTERLHSNQQTYLSITDREISGGYMLKPNFKGRAKHIANATYFVSKGFRGTGLGKKLGEHSLLIAKELGYHGMQFNSVVSTNLTAINLWHDLDFKTIGIIPNGFRTIDGNFVDLHILYREL